MNMENQFQKSGKEYQTMTTIIIKEYWMKSKCGSACFVHTQQLSMQEYSARRNTMVLKRSIQHILPLKDFTIINSSWSGFNEESTSTVKLNRCL